MANFASSAVTRLNLSIFQVTSDEVLAAITDSNQVYDAGTIIQVVTETEKYNVLTDGVTAFTDLVPFGQEAAPEEPEA